MVIGHLEQERLYRQMFEKNSAVKLLIEPETGMIVDANPAAIEYYGYALEDLRSMNIDQINTLRHEEIMSEMDNALRDQRSFFRFKHRLANGEIRDVEINTGRIDLGHKAYLYSIVTDVTERNRFEAELRRANADLERMVAERTGALMAEIDEHKRTLAALSAAKEAAEKADRTKTEFLASVSHELRTPLNAIIGYSDPALLELFHNNGTLKYHEFMRGINEAGLLLLDLINDVLDVAAIEAGNMALRPCAVETLHLCEAVERLVRSRAERKRIALQSDLAEAPPVLKVDERRVKQILVNLLGNAIKFTPENGRVAWRVTGAPDGGVCMVVADSGIGMDKEGIETALKPFGQIDNPLSRDNDGVGIGLPLTLRLVEDHGGRMMIDSVPGKGTSVTVRLPPSCVAEAAGLVGCALG